MRGAPGPQGMTGIPGPAVRDPQFILFLFLTIKYFFFVQTLHLKRSTDLCYLQQRSALTL